LSLKFFFLSFEIFWLVFPLLFKADKKNFFRGGTKKILFHSDNSFTCSFINAKSARQFRKGLIEFSRPKIDGLLKARKSSREERVWQTQTGGLGRKQTQGSRETGPEGK
jgi:hypothetical protein